MNQHTGPSTDVGSTPGEVIDPRAGRSSGDHSNRLIVVSNRLPIVVTQEEGGEWMFSPGSGGLVTALVPVLRDRGGVWIGWPGTTADVPNLDQLLHDGTGEFGYELRPVLLSEEEHELFYHGYSNETVWPLFHDLQSQAVFQPTYRSAYEQVNRKYAEAIAEACTPDDFIWVHDYHLMLVGEMLREISDCTNLAFFLHIPFPHPDIFMKLPGCGAVLKALLSFNLIGLQTQRDHRNFVQCVRTLLKPARVKVARGMATIWTDDREVHVGAFPIGIDARDFAARAARDEVAEKAWFIHEELPDRQIVLGVDRLDYTKGIPHRLEAFRNLLSRHPDLHGHVNLIQVVVPSRVGIPKYDALKTEIEQLVGEINGRFTQSGWVPIHYIFRSLSQIELLGYYRTAEVALITPLKDGMNLVAKEFCACSLEENAVLVLSQFAGASAQLGRHALVVNPYDVEETADALFRALTMPTDERRYHMHRLRRNIRRQDIFWWVDSFMKAAIDKDLRSFPVIEEYIPPHDREDVQGWTSQGEGPPHT
jgi:trehalose 6-phosphate synthase